MIFLSVKDLAEKEKVSRQAILLRISLGQLDAIKIGHDWRIFFVDRFLQPKIERTRRSKKC